ncbi:hypothetical protein [Mediterraneibacter glycyrrhizinilyticus]|uniref:hypothetical protein n=1 Tax=Mediterraneibacter glycyrrhizinilyticus TaxID=342942 RepID=UPI0025A3915A|nr:hypothetical protein [Mediterraneibacter glycyrrhizinilyticus]MDM8209639.1 hypothetical protein [Mediterraneibacter glycyrrhizinilyticus]
MAFKKSGKMKVYEQSGYRYKSTPTIILNGQWMNRLRNTEGGARNGQDHNVWFI